MPSLPKITFGIIILNNEPFTRYLLRQLYPFAHQIIVVEGATVHGKHAADPKGHSTDGTLDVLRELQSTEDPGRKIQVVTAEEEGHPNGFWPGEKDEMSRAYTKRATGDWLWQVDGDEFYTTAGMGRVCELITQQPDIATISFPGLTFWGSPDYWVDGFNMRDVTVCGQSHRLFRWKPGYQYVTHRLATVADENGTDLRQKKWLNGNAMRTRGVFMFHYSMLFPSQVASKVQYYASLVVSDREKNADSARRSWETLDRPFHVYNITDAAAWLERFRGEHPEQVRRMWRDVLSGRLRVERRKTEDVEQLLHDPFFRAVRWLVRWEPSQRMMRYHGAYRLHRIAEGLANGFDRHWQRREKSKVASGKGWRGMKAEG